MPVFGTLSYYLDTRRVDKYYCPTCENTFNYPKEVNDSGHRPYGSGYALEELYRDVCPYCGENEIWENDIAWRGKLKGSFKNIKRIRRIAG